MKEKTVLILERIVIPGVLLLALIAVSFWGVSQSARAEGLQSTAEGIYSRAVHELSDDMDNLSVTLGKLQVAASPAQCVLLLDDVWRLSGSGVSLMSQIPASHIDTEGMNRFVVQLGDYAHSLTKKALRGAPMSDDDMQQLSALQGKCAELSNELKNRIESGDMPVAVVTNEEYYLSASAGENAAAGSGAAGGGAEGGEATGGENAGESSAGDGGEAEGEYQEQEGIEKFPTLIYDGPFSESTEKLEAKGLSGSEVTQEQALEKAREAAGVELSYSGNTEGKLPTYDFTGSKNGGELYVSVTRQGGQILYMMGAASAAAEGLPEQSEAVRFRDAALGYLSGRGYPNMQATYAQYYAGCALINCAAVQDGVILYNDLIKVWVDREDLSIVGVDARNYLFSHTQRSLEQPEISIEEAEAALSKNISVKARALALIPLTPASECLCYEFKGTLGEAQEEYIIYVNAKSGEEEQIYLIVDSEDGQSVI